MDTVAPSDDVVGDNGNPAVCPYTAIASGTAHRIAVFSGVGTLSESINIGIYTDSDGAASMLIAQATVTNIRRGAWNIVTISGVPIVQGTQYWIGLNPLGGVLQIRDRDGTSGATTVYAYPAGGSSSLPPYWQNGQNFASGPWSAYLAE
jgi:hypothetical protein